MPLLVTSALRIRLERPAFGDCYFQTSNGSADFADRSLGIGYAGGSSLLFACVIATLGAWYWSQGSISVATVTTPKVEAFYWVAITFSQTLGTALGDWMADADAGYPPSHLRSCESDDKGTARSLPFLV
jgi:hypothetical protein